MIRYHLGWPVYARVCVEVWNSDLAGQPGAVFCKQSQPQKRDPHVENRAVSFAETIVSANLHLLCHHLIAELDSSRVATSGKLAKSVARQLTMLSN